MSLLFGIHDPERAYPSDHRRVRGAEEMLADALDKERAAQHYTQLAAALRQEVEVAEVEQNAADFDRVFNPDTM